MSGKLLVAVALIAIVIVAVNRALGPGVDPDAPVSVLSAPSVRVILPAEPDVDAISTRLGVALGEAAARAEGLMRDELIRTASGDAAGEIAVVGARWFGSDRAAALAFPLYSTRIVDDGVVITATTVELVPQHLGIGRSIAHERGHATINERLAVECGPAIVAAQAERGLRGAGFEAAVTNALLLLGDDAHSLYHLAVNGIGNARFAAEARNAADEVIDAGCVR